MKPVLTHALVANPESGVLANDISWERLFSALGTTGELRKGESFARLEIYPWGVRYFVREDLKGKA
jgi:hypothetical protein